MSASARSVLHHSNTGHRERRERQSEELSTFFVTCARGTAPANDRPLSKARALISKLLGLARAAVEWELSRSDGASLLRSSGGRSPQLLR
jgi:hypothetical protein